MKNAYIVTYKFQRAIFEKHEIKAKKIMAVDEKEAVVKCVRFCASRLYKWFDILAVEKAAA